ncbi:BatD family protein [Rhodanobacter sp. Col0626]|uniref:BatD family protein n=1 Tax=Rhodanobacter sp. Col0626 TaxID=3415679 RepID=UPI003CF9CA83
MTCWWLALLLVPAMVHATDVQATLDRSSVQLGETVTLNLRIDNAGGNIQLPDLSVLNQDFSILGTSQNSNLSIVNGKASSTLTIGVALRPSHVGTLQIPALSVDGSRTAPLQLQVSAPDPAGAATTHNDVFMEAQAEPAHGYVGQQLSYVLRLYYATNISNGALSAPQVDGLEVSRVGSDLNYDAQRGGRTYHVLERRYALVPQHAGKIEIPAASFQGEAIDPNDPDSFFGSSTPISASAPAVSIDVQPPPADWGRNAWLPARQLSLTLDGWPGAQDSVRVGQPLNLTMNLQATGVPFEALPALSLPSLDGAKVYPDKPVTGNRQDGQWMVGRRQQSFAIVPERAGTLTIPATTLKWWNVLTDHMEVAQVPAHDVTVLPAIGAAVQPSSPAPALAPASGAAAPATTALAQSVPWRWIALGSVGLWLLSTLAWWLWRRRRVAPIAAPAAARTSARQCQLAFLAAARGSDTAAQARSLLAWARAERPAIQHLGELAAALDAAAQRAAIASLQQRQYAGTPLSVAGADLAQVFKRGFVWRVSGKPGQDTGLPPLYPFKLH